MAWHFIVYGATRAAALAAANAAIDGQAAANPDAAAEDAAAKVAVAAYAALLAPGAGDDDPVEEHQFRLSVSNVLIDIGDVGSPKLQMVSFGVEASLVALT
jgi:hypothetical protein